MGHDLRHAAAQILTDLLTGRGNENAPVFSPQRSIFKPQLLVNGLSTVGNLLTPLPKRCTHLGCALHYNRQEHSWDCPCHGSRFDAQATFWKIRRTVRGGDNRRVIGHTAFGRAYHAKRTEPHKIETTVRDRLLRAWENSMEMARDFEGYSDEYAENEKYRKVFSALAVEEARHAAQLRELLHAYQREHAEQRPL